MRIRSPFLAILVSAGLAAAAEQQAPSTETAAPPKGVRVFVCGHSFHVFIAEPLAALAKEAGLVGHRTVGVDFLGNSRPIRHWDVPDGANAVKRALNAGAVDVLTLAPHGVVPDEGIDRFADLAIERNPDVRVYLQLSWSPFDGKPPAGFRREDRDRVTPADLERADVMGRAYQARLRAQARSINERHGREFVYIVPAGVALRRLRAEVIGGRVPGVAKQSELFKDANGHGTDTLKCLVTYCWFAAVYRRSPVGLSALEAKGDDTSHRLHRRLQEIAWDAVTADPFSGVKAP